jgi:chorismate mutase/prephenate dehydratase
MAERGGEADLQGLRERLEELDHELLRVLRRRLDLVEEVARAKVESAWPFRDAQREERLLVRIRKLAVEEGLDPHEVERLFRVVLDLSVAHQQAHVRGLETAPLRVAYQGTEGSYSHLAAQRRYGGRAGGVLLSGHETFRGAAEAVTSGEADLALLPIENTTAGSINETYDLLAEGGLVVTGEVIREIEHCLLALPGVALDEIRVAMSHPQALRQCEGFFRAHPQIQPREEFDTAGAARKVRERGDRALAAIAGANAAQVHGLEIVARGIQTVAGNSTRFVEVGLQPVPVPGGAAAKTSLLVSLADRPGALGDLLQLFSARGLNLTKLESRPIPGDPWRYRFYLDVAAHASIEPFPAVLAAAREHAAEIRVLGTYPAAE